MMQDHTDDTSCTHNDAHNSRNDNDNDNDKLDVLNTHTIEATILDLTGILVEKDIHYHTSTTTHSNNPKSDDAVTAIVSFARRPHKDGTGYTSNDQQSSAISHPIRNGSNYKPSQKHNHHSNRNHCTSKRDLLIEEHEAVWYGSSSSSVSLPANFYNVRKEIYDVMVHLVKASEPIPLAVGKLVVRGSDLSENDGCAFMVNLNVKALFRRIYNDNSHSDNMNQNSERGVSKSQSQAPSSPTRRETVLSFALSNGYSYGVSNDAVLRVRLDVKQKQRIDCDNEDTGVNRHNLMLKDPTLSNNVKKLLMDSYESGTAQNKNMVRDANQAASTQKRSPVSQNVINVPTTSKPAVPSPRLESKASSSRSTSLSLHGNIDPKELLGTGLSSRRSSLTASEAHKRHLKRLEKLKEKHNDTKELQTEQVLWALQNHLNSDDENSAIVEHNQQQKVNVTPKTASRKRQEKKEKKESTMMSLAKLILDFNPCVDQCNNIIDQDESHYSTSPYRDTSHDRINKFDGKKEAPRRRTARIKNQN